MKQAGAFACSGESAASVRTASSCASTGLQYQLPFASRFGSAAACASCLVTVSSFSSERWRAA